jgi:hypothetical protein
MDRTLEDQQGEYVQRQHESRSREQLEYRCQSASPEPGRIATAFMGCAP